MDKWLAILALQVEVNGVRATAGRLGVSPALISQVNNGKRSMSPDLKKRIAMRLGGGVVACPILGEIDWDTCTSKYTLAVKVGGRATGNPITLRLFRTCIKCRNWDGGGNEKTQRKT